MSRLRREDGRAARLHRRTGSSTSGWAASCTTSARSARARTSSTSPARSTPEEFEHIKGHAALGERILAPFLAESPMVLRIVRSHHERLDGTGFPDRLVGEHDPGRGPHRRRGGRLRRHDDQPGLSPLAHAGGRGGGASDAARAPISTARGRRGVSRGPSATSPSSPSPSDRRPASGPDVRHPDDQRFRNARPRRHRSHPRARRPPRRRLRRLGARLRGRPAAAGAGARGRARPGRRTSGPMFTRAATSGLMSVGVDVIEVGDGADADGADGGGASPRRGRARF